MSNKSPIFPMPEPQHFSDYGFDPQIDYFQILEEARNHKRDSFRSVDALHFKLQKPISKEDSKKSKKKKKRWWRNALLFWKWKWTDDARPSDGQDGVYRRNRVCRGAVSGPLYITESISGSTTPCRTSCHPTSGPLAGTLTPTRKGEVEIPYLSLRELNIEQQQPHHRFSTSAMPIYLVT
ncbi:PREDICTED: uncharacterized protein LOC104598899 isoform X2 [Nelumbo nucifera]|uniref:Uncharacterized protein LOC104598899 isoform X2 n=2 Tax=Nelumbo nucifera TaxID=4432 RepID=A0A1U7ZY65_NELNU|nr:PREDICTED: uncharacterized protein LOC104598899 isoform X2 [Nelumbo nucifera]DAD38126.1 TPA_asm: hypothetical protein HUJ06_008767 [Nelumbo nucifera]